MITGELLTLQIQNKITIGQDVPKATDIKIYSNKTIFELKILIAKEFKTSWDTVFIFIYF